MSAEPAYVHRELFPLGPDPTPYRKLTADGVRVERLGAREVVVVEREAIRRLAEEAMVDINHLLRPGHLRQLAAILDDPEATGERQVRRLRPPEERQHRRRRRPADVPGHRHRDRHGQEGPRVWTDGDGRGRDRAGHPRRVPEKNLRYSQVAPLSMFEEVNTRYEPAGADRHLCRGRATPTSSCSSPRAAARRTRPSSTRRRRRC